MKSRNKTLILNMIFFGTVTIVSKGISYFLLPLFTTYMSTEDYGIADLLVSTVNLLYPLTALGMGSAILRYTAVGNDDKRIVFTVALRIIIIMSLISLLPVAFIGKTTVLGIYIWFVPVEMLLVNLSSIMVCLGKGLGKTSLYLCQALVRGVVLIISAFITLKFGDMGIAGYIVSYLLADIVSLIFFAFLLGIHKYIVCRIDFQTWKFYGRKLIKYGAPLIPNSMSAWVLQMSDRYMVAYWHGTSINGLYAVAYKIPSLIKVFTSMFISAWQLNVISESESEDSLEYFNKMKRLYSAICLITAAVIMAGIRLLAVVLFANEFYEAWRYVPLLLLASVASLFAEYLGTYFYAKDQTNQLFLSTLLGAIVNILLNIVLIPRYAAWGATIATAISAVVLYLYRCWDIWQKANIRFISMEDCVGILLLAMICVAYYISDFGGGLLSCVITIVILWLFRKELLVIFDLLRTMIRSLESRGNQRK